jgi:hypothetical protein
MTGVKTMYDTPTVPLPGRDEDRGGLAERIERHIEDKLCGRIRYLHVACPDGLIVLQGRSRTYHAKQLAQEAAFDLTDGAPRLVNEIVVY